MFQKLSFFLTLLILSLFTFSTATFAQNNFKAGEVSKLEREETINNDYFATGEKVVLSGTVNGDSFLAGGDITVDGVVNGDLLVAGGNISITGTVNGNVRIAGGNVEISGNVLKNATVVGGNISLQKSGRVGGNLSSAGGNIKIFAPVDGKINIGGGDVTFASSSQDINIGVGELTLASTATVSGSLNYWSEEQADISKDATISGSIVHNLPPNKGLNEKEINNGLTAVKKAFNVFNFLSLLVLGTLLIFVFPVFFGSASQSIIKNPWKTLGLGLLTLIVTPILIIILLITLIGIPLALILVFGFVFVIYTSKIFVALLVGQKVFGYFNNKVHIIFEFLIGLIIITALGELPVVGGLITFIILLFGLGAYIQAKTGTYKELRAKKMV